MMDVSFSAWRHSREESLALKGDSFSFLFDRRYTNRLNRMSRVFFEAYVVATKELAAQEDRFPSLSEIDAKMESGAVYAFKDRLMKNTEFFEEVKISGVSYLVPRAPKFIDTSGTYTDLILNFEEGTVVLPTRRKTAAPPLSGQEEEEPDEIESPDLEEEVPDQPTLPSSASTEAPNKQYPSQAPEQSADSDAKVAPPEAVAKPQTATQPEAIRVEPPYLPSKKPEVNAAHGDGRKRMVAVALGAAAVLLAIGAVIIFAGLPPSGAPTLVKYSAYLSNASNESYLGMDINNPQEMSTEMEMVLPKNIDQSISARGGVVTISHGEETLVKMNSSGDANVKIYLLGNWTTVPMTLNLAVPKGFDSGLVVHGKDYFVTRKDENMVLSFNLTTDGVSFEQSYSPKR
ncbi:MAG: hypothetical protein NTW84_01015 [Methanothrix sp.]|nr:hypothetical protein [Methanothrix sp.]